MERRAIAWALGAVMVVAAGIVPGDATDVVSIIMRGAYFSEPANVGFVIAVEPNEENRVLWVELDSGALYRASEVMLDGAHEKRQHPFLFKHLPGGDYMLRAEVRSQSAVRGLATRRIMVAGKALR